MKWYWLLLIGLLAGAATTWVVIDKHVTKSAKALHDSVVVAEVASKADSINRALRAEDRKRWEQTLDSLRKAGTDSASAGEDLAIEIKKRKTAEDSAKAMLKRATSSEETIALQANIIARADDRADEAERGIDNMTNQRDDALRRETLLLQDKTSLEADTTSLGAERDRWRKLAERGDTIAQRLPPKLFLGFLGRPTFAVGLGGTAGYGATLDSDGKVHTGRTVALGLTGGVVIPIGRN